MCKACKGKKRAVICSGPPLNYYTVPSRGAGKGNFIGLFRKHDVMEMQRAHAKDPGQDDHFQERNLQSDFLHPVGVRVNAPPICF